MTVGSELPDLPDPGPNRAWRISRENSRFDIELLIKTNSPGYQRGEGYAAVASSYTYTFEELRHLADDLLETAAYDPYLGIFEFENGKLVKK